MKSDQTFNMFYVTKQKLFISLCFILAIISFRVHKRNSIPNSSNIGREILNPDSSTHVQANSARHKAQDKAQTAKKNEPQHTSTSSTPKPSIPTTTTQPTTTTNDEVICVINCPVPNMEDEKSIINEVIHENPAFDIEQPTESTTPRIKTTTKHIAKPFENLAKPKSLNQVKSNFLDQEKLDLSVNQNSSSIFNSNGQHSYKRRADVIIYNRVPKSMSTLISQIMFRLSDKHVHDFHFENQMELNQSHFFKSDFSLMTWIQNVYRLQQPSIIVRHQYFVNIKALKNDQLKKFIDTNQEVKDKKIIWINFVRHPVEQFIARGFVCPCFFLFFCFFTEKNYCSKNRKLSVTGVRFFLFFFYESKIFKSRT